MRATWVIVVLLCAGCGKKPEEAGEAAEGEAQAAAEPTAAADDKPAPAPAAAAFPGTEAGAKALLEQFLDPSRDIEKMSAALKPRASDYAKVFAGEAAKQAEAAYGPAWAAGAMQVKPKPGQTALLLWSATSEEIKAWEGDAKAQFPGGYQRVGDKLLPGLRFYRFKFVEPGKTLGMAYDGLVYVDGRWTIFPKPWRALAAP